MKVIVLGAGVIGVTSAYYLNKAGHDVEVYDENYESAMGTSFANAGQVSVAYSAPWAAPGIPLKALKWMSQQDAPFKLNFDLSKDQTSWLFKFLANCNSNSYHKNKVRMLNMSMLSQQKLADLRRETNIQYHGLQKGTLQLFRDIKQLESNQLAEDLKSLKEMGIQSKLITSKSELVKIEPGLATSRANVEGGLWMPGDETGDCNMFTRNLKTICENNGVKFFFNSNIANISFDGNNVRDVLISGRQHTADAYVVCLGVWSKGFVSEKLNLPIYPVRGYSATLSILHEQRAPVSTVLDETYKVAITRLGNRIRAGGFAELDGYTAGTPEHQTDRFNLLVSLVSELFPGSNACHINDRLRLWSGLRPMTPFGVPLVGETKVKNLYLNTGHGTLGWTMSCGSASHLSDVVSGKETELNTKDYKFNG